MTVVSSLRPALDPHALAPGGGTSCEACGEKDLPTNRRNEPGGLVGDVRRAQRTPKAPLALPPGRADSPSVIEPKVGRDGEIRTRDPLNPIQVRYQAAPRPDRTARSYRKRAMITSSSRLASARARRRLSTSSRRALSSRGAAAAAGGAPASASSARRFFAPATVKRSS